MATAIARIANLTLTDDAPLKQRIPPFTEELEIDFSYILSA
jgi:hypothetical protein